LSFISLSSQLHSEPMKKLLYRDRRRSRVKFQEHAHMSHSETRITKEEGRRSEIISYGEN
jgi:hypothetical protein